MRKEEKEEKRQISWDVVDPKPPVIHSGHLENQIQHTTQQQTGRDTPDCTM